MNYNYYCPNHGQDLCEDCQKEHNCENIKNFDSEKLILDDEIPFIANCLTEKNITISKFMDENQMSNELISYDLKLLISCILNNYYENPNYNTIENIKNFYDRLKK